MGKRKGEAAKTKTDTEIRAGSDRYRMVLRPMNQWEYMRAESPRAVREAAVSTFKGVLLAGMLFGVGLASIEFGWGFHNDFKAVAAVAKVELVAKVEPAAKVAAAEAVRAEQEAKAAIEAASNVEGRAVPSEPGDLPLTTGLKRLCKSNHVILILFSTNQLRHYWASQRYVCWLAFVA